MTFESQIIAEQRKSVEGAKSGRALLPMAGFANATFSAFPVYATFFFAFLPKQTALRSICLMGKERIF